MTNKFRYNKFKSYGVDSKWELKLKNGIFANLQYHPKKISYTKPATDHTYEPDWVITTFRGFTEKRIYIEAKGRFRDRAEWTKYLYIREALTDTEELIFLFMRPQTPMPGAQTRKNGTKRSHSEWAEAEGFRWYDETSILTLIGDKQ